MRSGLLKPITRREALAWLAVLGGGAATGMCGIGGLVGLLAARRASSSIDPLVVTPVPELVPSAVPPSIIPREAWGARPINHAALNESGFSGPDNPTGWHVYVGDLAEVYSTVAIHHSFPVRRDSGTMRAIQDLHLDAQQWADIGYHFGVGGDGTLYAGRDITVRGASVAGYNTGTIGVVVIGNFEEERPAMAQLQALQTLILWLAATYTLTHLAGHYEFNPTTVCPGANLRVYLDVLAQNAGLQRGTGGYVPPAAGRLYDSPTACC